MGKVILRYRGSMQRGLIYLMTANPRYRCAAVNGRYSGILLAQGCSSAGDVYAKQFAEEGNLKGIGNWYRSVGAQVGGEVRVTFTSPNSLEIEYLG